MKNDIIGLYPASDRILVKSKGCYQYDSEGREYIDFESGVWSANLGHSHDRIIRVLEKQSGESMHHGYRFRNEFSERLSNELMRLVGFDRGASVFLSSGSEAVNLSIIIAQRVTKRKKILKISNSYLSAYGFGAISPDNAFLDTVPFNDPGSPEHVEFQDYAAVVLETGGASIDVVRFPEETFVKRMAELAQKNNCLVIADEVTTGFGRTGRWFGFQHYGIRPDMVVTGKALGNGYPVSAVTVNASVSDRLNTDLFRYAQSHQNDPLGCAVALEVINIIEQENLIDKCISIGQYFYDQLISVKYNHREKIREVRCRGLMLAVEFRESFDGDSLSCRLFEEGFIVGFKKNSLRFLPPLVISAKEIDKLVTKLEELISKTD